MNHLAKGIRHIFSPVLATKIGLNGAIVLERLHYELLKSPIKKDGHKWFIHTYDQWNQKYRFWSKDTIVRIIKDLEMRGFVVSTSRYNINGFDRRKWYTIDYRQVDAIGYKFIYYDAKSYDEDLKNPLGIC